MHDFAGAVTIDNGIMQNPADLYFEIGGATGCRALAKAFYARVDKDPLLRPFFPSTFTCAIEEFAAFLVQFLGGEAEATQRRWWLSLRESHNRFKLGERERQAWLRAMTTTLEDSSVIASAEARAELLAFFHASSAHVVKQPPKAVTGELGAIWNEQLALDEAVALIRQPRESERCVRELESPVMLSKFERSPSVHASMLSLAARAKSAAVRDYAVARIRANPQLVHELFSGGRTLLHDAAGTGNAALVEELLAMGAYPHGDERRSPLYAVANECLAPSAGKIVRLLLEKGGVDVNAIHGSKRCTALHMAARRGNTHTIAALLDGGADIDARDSLGVTPLRRAMNCKKPEAVTMLLARGAKT